MKMVPMVYIKIAILVFIKSLEDGNSRLFKDSVLLFILWFFALDHPNYARWVPTPLCHITRLQDNVPVVDQEFQNAKFVLKKSAIVID